MATEQWTNSLYFGDNLDILREHIADESVDLIYLDPPFNSNATYNVLFREGDGERSAAQITAFDDTWRWSVESELAYRDVVTDGPRALSDMLQAMRSFLGQNDMMAYLTMMAQRMVELHRVLKPAGSIYLHCDPNVSHYLKLMLDSVFGARNFRNEIVWHYRKWSTGRYAFQRNHDVILFYSRTPTRERTFNQLYMDRALSTTRRFGASTIISGRDESGQRLPSRTSEEESPGVRQDDVWDIGRVPPIRQLFPTQKPEPLLERIISASSNEGDVVLDPFCGCGTATIASERLNRRWIGIDITHLAIALIRHRLQDTFGDALRPYDVVGDPKDLAGARALARHDRYQFEWWALGLVDARPAQDKRRGADSGIDGYINFFDDNSGRAKRVVVQVKSGSVGVAQIRDLKGVVERENAAIGVFITLRRPTAPMTREALAAGFYAPEHYPDLRFPRLQIFTIEELLGGTAPQYPRVAPQATFRRAPRNQQPDAEQFTMV